MNTSIHNYTLWHCLRMFFEDIQKWRDVAPLFGIESMLTQQEYDDMLKGTNTHIYVPLWASCVKSNTKLLMDETTLSVIKAYKAEGYCPALMDGNPPDYLGEQFRFLEYLEACRLMYGETGDALMLPKTNASDAFIEAFTLDTVKAVTAALCKASDSITVQKLCTVMSDAVAGRPVSLTPLEFRPALFPSEFPDCTPGRPIPLEDTRRVKIANVNDCGAKCLMNAIVQEGCILGTEPDKSVLPFTGCPRGRAYRNTFMTADRLRYPMIRRGERGSGLFRRLTWQEAVETLHHEISKQKGSHGPGALYVTSASGVSAAIRGDRFMKRLLGLNGGFADSYNYYSCTCAVCAAQYTYGVTSCGNSTEDLLNSKLIILWGHNPANTHFGPFLNNTLARCKEKNIPIIVIDPRASETALTYADRHIPIRPSSDSAMTDAMCFVIWSKGLQDQAFMDKFCLGFDEQHMPNGIPAGESYHSYLFGEKDGVRKTPQWAEAITGVPASVIEELAVEYATAKPACLMAGLGPQRTMNGEQAARGFMALACLTGNVGVAGGGTGSALWREGKASPAFTDFENPYPLRFPSFLWTKLLDDPSTIQGGPDGILGMDKPETAIKLVFSLGNSQTLNQHSNINETIRRYKEGKPELLVTSDLFMTPGALYSDIVLPAASFLEQENIVGAWSPDTYFLYNRACTSTLFEWRFEYQWIEELAEKLGILREFQDGKTSAAQWLEFTYERLRAEDNSLPDYEAFKEAGIHVYAESSPYVAFRDNVENGTPFPTASGKIEIFSPELYAMDDPEAIPPIPRFLPCKEGPTDPLKEKYPLQLVGFKSKRRCHSIHDLNPVLEELDAPVLWINSKDAAERNIDDKSRVTIFNDRGKVRSYAFVTDRIMQGVIALEEGVWYTPGEDGIDERGCINVLTYSEPTALSKANPQHTNLAQVVAGTK